MTDPAFSAACLLRAARMATLATQSGGQPFASLVTPAIAPGGAVLMLLSGLSMHTRHLEAEPRCAVMVTGVPDGANPQTAPRVTVTGRAVRIDDPASKRFWVARHPYARFYADFTDFALWRIQPEAAQYVGGFAQAHVVSGADLVPPEDSVRALTEAADRIIGHCNDDHGEALSLLARAQGASGPWLMLGVDPDGFDLRQDDRVLRVAFDARVADAAGVRAALVRLVEAVRR
jgi:putative heme iron utilization protein